MMRLNIPPGKYVVAVSGGVDSMTLLHLLAQRRKKKTEKSKQNLELIVAHFNHGIRRGSDKDEKLVSEIAAQHGLKIEVGRGSLGPATSEDKARRARYRFLESAKSKHQADGIITAHHQDDLIETALINILRGTGRRGMTAIKDNQKIGRPLLEVPKKELVAYASQNRLTWRDDPSNQSTTFLRNYIRLKVIPRLSDSQRAELIKDIDKVAKNNKSQNELIATISRNIKEKDQINRRLFNQLPVEVGNELIISWLRDRNFLSYSQQIVERLNTFLRTGKPDSRYKVSKGLELVLSNASAHFELKHS